jgi:hypothetical protein
MNQQRTSHWPYLVILVCMSVAYAVLPGFRGTSVAGLSGFEQQSRDTSPSVGTTAYKIDVLPPLDEIDPSPLQAAAFFEPAMVTPCAALLGNVSGSDDSDAETVEPIPAEQSQPADTNQTPSARESEKKNSTKDQSNEPVAAETPDSQTTTLIANLPKVAKTPADIVKPGSLNASYPNTGLQPLGPADRCAAGRLDATRSETSAWAEPTSLLSLLLDIAKGDDKPISEWSDETARLVHELGPALADGSDETGNILDRLADLRLDALRLADSAAAAPLSRKLHQAAYAIERRLEVWRQVHALGASAVTEADKSAGDPQRMSVCLAEIDKLTRSSPDGRQWRNYLLVEALKEVAFEQAASESLADDQRKITQQVLARLTELPLSNRQRQFIATQPMAGFCDELRHWAADPAASAEVLRDIEQYEQTRLPSAARRLGQDMRSLVQSPDPQRVQLGRSVESHYRNANVRVSLTGELLNRLVPQQKTEIATVRDTLMGIPVRGQSMTSADVALRLIPDPDRVRMALEVTGEVAAMTSATSGPATFYNDSDSQYSARKPFEINQKGIKLMPAEVDVQHQTRLRDVATDFDGIPLLGMVARSVARQQHEMTKPQANQEARSKVANKARQRIDTEARDRLADVVDNLNRKLFAPLTTLSLDPTVIEAQTTAQRITMRLRVAGEDQLGSFAPRPQAPENSLASFQIGESTLNNAVQRLQLDGHTFTLPQLAQRISERFQRPNTWQFGPESQDLTITFAKKDAVTLRCQDGKVVFTLNVAAITKEPRQWDNFQVRIFYRPQINGRSAELVRDGVIQLIAPRMSNGSQFTLRGMFSKAFPQNDTIKLTPERFLSDSKLQDLAVTQFVIDDGWAGLAIGPKQYALRLSQRTTTRE